MIIKRLKKVLGLGILIGIRQGYFLLRNIYELYYQPYLTIKELINKRDKSQIFLISLAAMTPSIVYVLARLVWDMVMYQRLLIMTGKVFLVAGGIQLLVLSYLFYWTFRVLKSKV